MIFTDALPFIIQGIVFATLIDTIGSVASRKLNFNYGYLAPLSLINYGILGYMASDNFGLKTAMAASFVVGLYDATVGHWLSLKLKANNGLNEEEENFASSPFMLLFLVFVCVLFGFIGHMFV